MTGLWLIFLAGAAAGFLAGICVTLRSLGDGTVCAWRVPAKSNLKPAVASKIIFDDGTDIFGQPLKSETLK